MSEDEENSDGEEKEEKGVSTDALEKARVSETSDEDPRDEENDD